MLQRVSTDSQHVLIVVEKKSTSYYGVEIPPIILEEFEMLKRNLLCFLKVSYILTFFLVVMVIWCFYFCLHLKNNSHSVDLIWSFFRNLKCLVKIMNRLIIFCKVSFSERKSSRYLNVFLNTLMKEIYQRKFWQCIHAFIKNNITNCKVEILKIQFYQLYFLLFYFFVILFCSDMPSLHISATNLLY